MKKAIPLLGVLVFLLSGTLPAQIFNNPKTLSLNYAVRISVALGKDRVSFYNASGSVSIQSFWKYGRVRAVPGSQITLNVYSKGLGTSIVDRENRGRQLDLVTSFFATAGFYDRRGNNSLKYIRPFNQFSATSVYHDLDYGVTYGTSFISNNNGRNQQIGNVNFNFDQIMIGYYNDGFWPFNLFAADLYDRFWTGGGHFSAGMNTYGLAGGRPWFDQQFIEYAYDRFTGNVQNGYKLSKELLLFAIPQRNTKDIFFNRAITSLSVRNRYGSSFGVGVYGQCPKCDIQDFLHRKLGFSRHLSFAKPTVVLMGAYQNSQFTQIKK